MSARVHHARLHSTRDVARDVVEYRYLLDADESPPGVSPPPLSWRAGQFISLACGHGDDGEPILRSYSIANLPSQAPDPAQLLLLLKLVEGGAASAWFRALPLGERVRFTGPMGFFVLDLAHAGDVVFGATGTGIAPIVPMIEELLARPETGRIHLYFGVRDEGDLFWQHELETLTHRAAGRLTVHTALSRPSPSWKGNHGRINTPLFDLVPRLSHPTFYLCGNGAMIREVKAGLIERGIDRKRQIRTEAFFD